MFFFGPPACTGSSSEYAEYISHLQWPYCTLLDNSTKNSLQLRQVQFLTCKMRKEQKVVAGFVGTLAGLIGMYLLSLESLFYDHYVWLGVLHVYLPFYSKVGQQAQERAGIKSCDSSNDKNANHSTVSPANSMWTNMKVHELQAKKNDLDAIAHPPDPSQDT